MANLGEIIWRVLELSCRSRNGSENNKLPSLHKVNDSVYEFYRPPVGMSFSSEILFFHGVDLGDSSKAYVETWACLDSVNCWPKTWLAELFPTARILSVSYDSSIGKGPKQGILDLDLTAENLVHDLLDGGIVSANPGCPVILVGKDLGGLIIKAICVLADGQKRFSFLKNLKGIFYYVTPHLGIENLPGAFNSALAEKLRFGDAEISRLGFKFSNLRRNKWATRTVLSLKGSEKVPQLVIKEASQRYDSDECYTSDEGIDTVCRYQVRPSSSFNFLTGLISHIERGEPLFESTPDQDRREECCGVQASLDFGDDRFYVPLETTLAEVNNALQKSHIVILHGGPGSGKSRPGISRCSLKHRHSNQVQVCLQPVQPSQVIL